MRATIAAHLQGRRRNRRCKNHFANCKTPFGCGNQYGAPQNMEQNYAWPSGCTSGYMLKRTESRVSKRDLNAHALGSMIHNSQEMKAHPHHIHWQMDEQNVACHTAEWSGFKNLGNSDPATRQMNPEDMLSETGQAQKDKYSVFCMFLTMIFKKRKKESTQIWSLLIISRLSKKNQEPSDSGVCGRRIMN